MTDEGARTGVALEVARALLAGSSLQESGATLIELLCRRGGWSLGALWWSESGGDQLRCRALWPEREPLASATRMMRFERDSGRLGEVWTTGRPRWIPRVADDPAFARRAAATAAELHQAYLLPLHAGGRTLGVLELLADERHECRDDHLTELCAMSADIGRALERLEVHSVSNAGTNVLAELIVRDAAVLFAFDHDGRLRLYSGRADEALGIDPLWLRDRPVFERVPTGHPLCRNLLRALAGEHVLDHVECPANGSHLYQVHFAPRVTERGIVGIVGLAIRIDEPDAPKPTSLAVAEHLAAARMELCRLVSFESANPPGAERDHRLELLLDARAELDRAEQALTRNEPDLRGDGPPVEIGDPGSAPIPVAITREDTNSGPLPS